MPAATKNKAAAALASQFKQLLDEANRLSNRDHKAFAEILADVYGHTIDNEPNEAPLDLDWTLSDGGVAKALYEELTGKCL